MPRQPQKRTTSSRTRTRASSAERRQKVSSEVATTTTTTSEADQQGRLRRVRSFTMRSGAVVNRGDSFKVHAARAGDGDVESMSRRRQVAAGVVDVDASRRPRGHSAAAAASRHRVPADYDQLKHTDVLRAGDDIISTDALYTVMVLGSDGVGKTTVIQQLLTSEYLANKDYNVGQSVSCL